jgi:hypothetical protein
VKLHLVRGGIRCLLGTRIHAGAGVRPDVSDLGKWCASVLRFADAVAIATDSELHDEVRARVAHLGDSVQVLLVSPWQGVTPALNAIVAEAKRQQADELILMSREVRAEPGAFEVLSRWMGPDVLVTGAKLVSEHGEHSGDQAIDALNSPWNTLAVWNVALLGLTGFPSICDGYGPDVPAGMEEVITISLLQQLYGARARAYLLGVPGVSWRPVEACPARKLAHERKMTTKVARAEAQLARMGIARGEVVVVVEGAESKNNAETLRQAYG